MPIARTMQLTGYALWAAAGALRVIRGRDAAPWAWLVAYLVLGLAFHLGAGVPNDAEHRPRKLGMLAIMVPATLAMAMIRPCPYGALALVVVASQAALVLPARLVALGVLAQTAVVGACLVPALGGVLGTAELIALLGFQCFAVATIASARREGEARLELARKNAALLATRSLLEEATRSQERARIARDLHDVLGHDLTALGLQLEIASHVDDASARLHTAKARELTERLLQDVRAVVAATRADPPSALVFAIRAVVLEAPGLAIHVDGPESLVVEETLRAECVVRCVQEIVTNARRHAVGAANLWIRLRLHADQIVVEAHDDGRSVADARDGDGLRGMRSRFEERGGRVEVRTAPGCAFVLNARLPLRSSLRAPS